MDTLVLGIGNRLWADEGFGVRAVEQLHQGYEFPARVKVLDGGTQGLYLLPHVQHASHLLIFDAIDYGLCPGTLKVVRDAEVPQFLGAKAMSLHQVGFQDTLAAARLTRREPRHLTLIGVQPLRIDDFGSGLTAEIQAAIQPALALGLAQLAAWGVAGQARANAEDALSPAAVYAAD